MKIVNGVKLGSSANLLYGFKASWNPSAEGDTPLFEPEESSVLTLEAEIQDIEGVKWDMPVITLCDTPEELLSKIFAYKIIDPDDISSNYSSGTLILNDKDKSSAIDKLKQSLGIDLSIKDQGYALVQIRRDFGSDVHISFERGVFGVENKEEVLFSNYKKDITRLRQGKRSVYGDYSQISLSNAQEYLNFFKKYGTHYVSKISVGDVIYQIFAYDQSSFKIIKEAYKKHPDQFSGSFAYSFCYYTRLKNNQGYGDVAQIGKLCIMSNDGVFQESLKKGEWKDDKWALGNSIFAPWLTGKVDLQEFKKIVPVGFELSPLSLFAEYFRKVTWKRVFEGAMYAKYGNKINVCFRKDTQIDFSKIYPQDNGFLSTIATPAINIYKTRFNPEKIKLAAESIVNKFTIFSNVINTGSNPISFPGKDVTLISHIFSLGDDTGSAASIVLEDEAYESYTLKCQEFLGAVEVQNKSGTKQHFIADGIRYSLIDSNERYYVSAFEDVKTAPKEKELNEILSSLEFSITCADTMFYATEVSDTSGTRNLITKFLNWIADIIPSESNNEKLHQIRLDALYLARAALPLRQAAKRVPYLTYKTYQPLIESIIRVSDQIVCTVGDYQQQIRQRQQQELVIDVSKNLNENIINSGKLLNDYIKTNAKQQEDLTKYHDEMIKQDDEAIAKTAASIKELSKLLDEQRMRVKSAVEHYETAVANWKENEILKFSMSIASNIFSLGFAVVIPSSSFQAVKSLGETAQKIQKFVGILDAINKLYTTLDGGLGKITSAEEVFSSLDSVEMDYPNALEWNEFGANMKLVLTQGPNVPEKNQLGTAFEILVMRGQALLNAQGNAQKLISDKYFKQRQQEIDKNQLDRLNKLDNKLNPKEIKDLDVNSIDLIGLTGDLEYQQNQIQVILAKTMLTQDQAMQYEYQQMPTVINSFDLLSLKFAIVNQNVATIHALERLSPPPKKLSQPIKYKIEGIPSTSLINGNSFKFRIPLSAKEFWPYTMVRIEKVVAAVEGIKSTQSGDYLARLLYMGNSFEDRDQERNPMCFNTVSRRFDYLYDVNTNNSKYGDETGVLDAMFSKITPFAEWEISLPKTQSNSDISFDGCSVNIEITFYIQAQLNDAPVAKNMLMSNASGSTTLSQMQGKSVLKGWDVVFNYTEEKINDLLLQQYDDEKNNPDFVRIIPQQINDYTDPKTKVTTRTKWSMKLGAPRIQFLTNNSQYVEIYMEILSGSYEYGIIADGKYIKISEGDVESGAHIRGNAALGKLQGAVNTNYMVVVDLSKGAFSTENMEITASNPLFDKYVTDYFVSLSTKYKIGILDLANHTTLEALTPKQFFFHILKTNAGKNILQLFITTDGTQLVNLGVDVDEPIPDGYECSLMISSRILFDKIMRQGFQSSSTFAIEGVNPGNTYDSWSAKITSGSIVGNFKSSNKNVRIDGNTNSVNVDMTGMIFKTDTATHKIGSSHNISKAQGFQYYTRHGHYAAGEAWDTYSWDNYSLNVTVDIKAVLPVGVSGTGQDQQVSIQADTSAIQIDGALSPAGACTTNDRQLQQEFLDQLRDQLPEQIRKQVDVPFKSVSLFALKNLLFPQKNIVDLKEAYTPGDLVIFGGFTK